MSAAEVECERLFQELTESSQVAFALRGLTEKKFRLGGHCFTLRFAGEPLAQAMSRSLAHLATQEATEPELVINCWVSAGTGTRFPMPHWPAHHFMGRGEIRGLDSPLLRLGYFDWIKLLNAYFPEKGVAFYCLENEGLPLQQLGSPALNVFNWWLGTLGWQLVHAAAVGTEAGGVLIVGHGGAGKSTLAFSTLGTRLRYLSDDYCVLAPGDPPQALALYGAGKLTETSVELLSHLRPHAANLDDLSREKTLFFLPEQFPGEQLLQTPLRAIVLSQLSRGPTRLHPIPWREVLGIVADSTMRQLSGSAHPEFIRMLRMIQHLPAFRLEHGEDRSAAHQLLLQLCES